MRMKKEDIITGLAYVGLAMGLMLLLAGCVAPTPTPTTDAQCTTSTEAAVNVKAAVLELGYTVELEQVLHLDGADAAAMLAVTEASYPADEVYAWNVTGENLADGEGVYVVLLLDGCVVYETVTDMATLDRYVRKAAAARGGV